MEFKSARLGKISISTLLALALLAGCGKDTPPQPTAMVPAGQPPTQNPYQPNPYNPGYGGNGQVTWNNGYTGNGGYVNWGPGGGNVNWGGPYGGGTVNWGSRW